MVTQDPLKDKTLKSTGVTLTIIPRCKNPWDQWWITSGTHAAVGCWLSLKALRFVTTALETVPHYPVGSFLTGLHLLFYLPFLCVSRNRRGSLSNEVSLMSCSQRIVRLVAIRSLLRWGQLKVDYDGNTLKGVLPCILDDWQRLKELSVFVYCAIWTKFRA